MADLREAWNKVRAHVAVGASISGVTRREALMALDEMLDVIPEYAALLAPRQPEVCGTCGGSGVIGTGMPDESGEQEELTSCPHCDGPAPARPPEPCSWDLAVTCIHPGEPAFECAKCELVDPAARPPEPLGSVLERLADPAADWDQAKADLRTVLTQPVNDPEVRPTCAACEVEDATYGTRPREEHDPDAECRYAAARHPENGDRPHRWVETSDPMTPMCVACGVRDGDQAADEACPTWTPEAKP